MVRYAKPARRSLEPLLKTLLRRASPVQFALF